MKLNNLIRVTSAPNFLPGEMEINLEADTLIWSDSTTSKEIGVKLREIKDIRHSSSPDMHYMNMDSSGTVDSTNWISIFYGTEFILNCITIEAESTPECQIIISKLQSARENCQLLTYRQRFTQAIMPALRYAAVTDNMFNVSKIKKIFGYILLPLSDQDLGIYFEGLGQRLRCYDNNALLSIISEVMFDRQKDILTDEITTISSSLNSYLNNNCVSSENLQRFSMERQGANISDDEANEIISNFHYCQEASIYPTSFFSNDQFIRYLFSKQNQIWDDKYDSVTYDMDQPLSHYFIASSHNTYLTGHQLVGKSSVDAYARILLKGCRCIELDCWPVNNDIVIYHGRTITTKLSFVQVLKTIKKYAFVTSKYPVILSLEDHCKVDLQRKMASHFNEIFGNMLLKEPFSKNEAQMPSPKQLRQKIILKHKKINAMQSDDDSQESVDIYTFKSNVYIEDPINRKQWIPKMAIISGSSLLILEDNNKEFSNIDMCKNETWYANLDIVQNGKEYILERLKSSPKNGSFLVADSSSNLLDTGYRLMLYFVWEGLIYKAIIYTEYEDAVEIFTLDRLIKFDCLSILLKFYMAHPLNLKNLPSTCLQNSITSISYEDETWFHPHIDKVICERVFRKIDFEGAFLFRPSARTNILSISFWYMSSIHHIHIPLCEDGFIVAEVTYSSLSEIVECYSKYCIWERAKLTIGITKETVDLTLHGLKIYTPYSMLFYQSSLAYDSDDSVDKDSKGFNDHERLRWFHPNLDRNSANLVLEKVNKDGAFLLRPSDNFDTGIVLGFWYKSNFHLRIVLKDGKYMCANEAYDSVLEIAEKYTSNNIRDDGTLKYPIYREVAALILAQKDEDEFLLSARIEGRYNIIRADISEERNSDSEVTHICRFKFEEMDSFIKFGFLSADHIQGWMQEMEGIRQQAVPQPAIEHNEKEVKSMEDSTKVAKELSDLVVYFAKYKLGKEETTSVYGRVTSLDEDSGEKVFEGKTEKISQYLMNNMIRIYPKALRPDSSNYDPLYFWRNGCQMVALNYQTPDVSMQLNDAFFLRNGKCGYELRPSEQLRHGQEDSGDISMEVTIKVLAAQHLYAPKRSNLQSHVIVKVEMYSFMETSTKKMLQSDTVKLEANGLCPIRTDSNLALNFTVRDASTALLRFSASSRDFTLNTLFLGQATYPLSCLSEGYRSVLLQNEFSEPYDLSSLLIYIKLTSRAD